MTFNVPEAEQKFARANFDASRSSSLYQDNLNEIRVNALFGLSLIRAYEV